MSVADKPILIKLAAYFLQDEAACEKFGVFLDKGIMLTGPIGCGKTSLMHLMRFLVGQESRYAVKSCRDITFEFIQDGYDVIHRYSRGNLYGTDARQ